MRKIIKKILPIIVVLSGCGNINININTNNSNNSSTQISSVSSTIISSSSSSNENDSSFNYSTNSSSANEEILTVLKNIEFKDKVATFNGEEHSILTNLVSLAE